MLAGVLLLTLEAGRLQQLRGESASSNPTKRTNSDPRERTFYCCIKAQTENFSSCQLFWSTSISTKSSCLKVLKASLMMLTHESLLRV